MQSHVPAFSDQESAYSRSCSANHNAIFRSIREDRTNRSPSLSQPTTRQSCSPPCSASCNADCSACSGVIVSVGGNAKTLLLISRPFFKRHDDLGSYRGLFCRCSMTLRECLSIASRRPRSAFSARCSNTHFAWITIHPQALRSKCPSPARTVCPHL